MDEILTDPVCVIPVSKDFLRGSALVSRYVFCSRQCEDWHARQPMFWAVVVAPWVLVQEVLKELDSRTGVLPVGQDAT